MSGLFNFNFRWPGGGASGAAGENGTGDSGVLHGDGSGPDQQIFSPHPYYPPGVHIANYAPNTVPVPVLLGCMVGMLGSTVLGVAMIARMVNPRLTRTDVSVCAWFTMCGMLHCFFEGYFVVNHATLASSPHLFAQLWKEYALSDSRYLTSDPFVVSVEGMTAFIFGPLSFACAVSIARGSYVRHPLRIIACIGQLYGVLLYYATSLVETSFTGRSHSRPEFVYFWLYFVGCNLPWVIVPIVLLVSSIKAISERVRGLEKVKSLLSGFQEGRGNGPLRELKKTRRDSRQLADLQHQPMTILLHQDKMLNRKHGVAGSQTVSIDQPIVHLSPGSEFGFRMRPDAARLSTTHGRHLHAKPGAEPDQAQFGLYFVSGRKGDLPPLQSYTDASDVRCNPSATPAQPCQRCAKLSLECVVDRAHKRMSRKSKIDELALEIQTIKQSVGGTSTTTTSQPAPPPPPPPALHVPIRQQLARYSPQNVTVGPFKEPAPLGVVLSSPGSTSRTAASASTPSITHTPATTLAGVDAEPALSRALGSQPFSGPDIDYYFQKFFDHFHPYLPIVRHRDPNKCYESCSVLFWTIILIACRRYAKSPQTLAFLTDMVRKELFASVISLPLSMSTINALILVSTWPFPDIRFINDPTPMLSSAAMNAAMLLGIHTGKGYIPEFSFGNFQNNFSNEDAAYTWSGCSIAAQRVSSYMGLPPLGGLFNQTVQNVIDGKTSFQVPSGFRVLLECQKFSNRLSKSMAAHLDESSGVNPFIVRHLEEEFDAIQGLVCSERADDLDRFNALIVRLEIQNYYLLPLPDHEPEALKRNILRTYTTARTVLRDVLELDSTQGFLQHNPYFYFRGILAATCVVYKVLRSAYCEIIDFATGEQSVADAITVFRRSSIVENDLPTRLANLLESAWGFHATKWHNEPVSSFSHRLGASVHFDCLRRWQNDMAEATRRGSQPPPPPPAGAAGEGGGEGGEAMTMGGSVGAAAATLGVGGGGLAGAAHDPLASTIDWSFMDDLDWSFDCIVPTTG